jgi:hypothetical protein
MTLGDNECSRCGAVSVSRSRRGIGSRCGGIMVTWSLPQFAAALLGEPSTV